MQKAELQSFIRSGGFAWPGGYPCALLMLDGEVIDHQAAREHYRQIRRATSGGWAACQVFIHWEGAPFICAHSGRKIDSAYGPTEAPAHG